MPELVVFVGAPGAGKSSFFRAHFAATHAHVSKDNFRSNPNPTRRQRVLIAEAFAAGRPVVVDNTHPDPASRAEVVAVAHAAGVPAVAYHFPSDIPGCLARNALRTGKARVPDRVVGWIAGRLVAPTVSEGFARVYRVTLADGGFAVALVEEGADAAE